MTAGIQLARNSAVRVLFLDNSDEVTNAPQFGTDDLKVVQDQAGCPDSFAAALLRSEPDVIVVPAGSERSALEYVRISQELCPAAPLILVVDSIDDAGALSALRAGAESLITRGNFDKLREVIEKALEVRKPLTLLSRRQLEVLKLVASGNTTRVIADTLKLSVKTIESHRTALMKRLGVHDVTALVRFAVRVGFAPAYEN
ncbi:MAG TPA: response regulator transcription factor [Gemmatimonadaceae bacterium]|nr:response regulator transcription factor [Gemmatimonadaceae bacterium]